MFSWQRRTQFRFCAVAEYGFLTKATSSLRCKTSIKLCIFSDLQLRPEECLVQKRMWARFS